jgi:hypothetical protein
MHWTFPYADSIFRVDFAGIVSEHIGQVITALVALWTTGGGPARRVGRGLTRDYNFNCAVASAAQPPGAMA